MLKEYNNNIYKLSHKVLSSPNIDDKLSIVDCLESLLSSDELCFLRVYSDKPIEDYARPIKPILVNPNKLEKRKISSVYGKAVLIHAIAHIEFNAIHLALDAIHRFEDMPKDYYLDWLKIAIEEAKHYRMLVEYLHDLGFKYGDFPAHNGLWEMAKKTKHDVVVRMALVPRLLEARGLDVTPGMIKKLEQANDYRAVKILKIIYKEEVGHVQIGNKWYFHLCNLRGIEPLTYFKDLLSVYAKGVVREPILDEGRRDAGFSEEELVLLHQIASEY